MSSGGKKALKISELCKLSQGAVTVCAAVTLVM